MVNEVKSTILLDIIVQAIDFDTKLHELA